MTVRVAVVDDDTLSIRAMREMITAYTDEFAVVAASSTVTELMKACDHPPDVVVLDVMLDRRAGPLAENVARLRRWGTQVLAVTAQPDRRELAEAVRHQNLNALAKSDLTEDVLRRAIHQTADGKVVLSPCLIKLLLRQEEGPPLTAREKQVLGLLGAGMPVKMVARRLNTREDTIRKHLNSIREKQRKAGQPVDNPVQLHRAALHAELLVDPHEYLDEDFEAEQ